MKILFVLNSFGPGGAEHTMTALANYWSSQGHVVVITQLNKLLPFYDLNTDIRVESLGILRQRNHIPSKVHEKIVIISRLKKVFINYQPDIIISFIDTTNILAIAAAKMADKKLIVSERTNCNQMKNIFWRALRNISYRYADGLVVLSKLDYDNYNYVRQKQIIPNPAWLLGEKIDLDIKKNIIISVGRLDELKGYDTLLKVLAQIPADKLKDWQVCILGEGSLEEELKTCACNTGLSDKVSFCGVQKNVIDFYRKAAIFISTSRLEGFPNALTEALTMGCACIATNCPTGPSELISHEENGILVEVDNISDIRNQLVKLIESEDLRKKLGYRAKESAKKYAINKIALQWENFIERVINT